MPVVRVDTALRQCALLEETLLRILDDLQLNGSTDGRWLAIARTHLQQGFIALDCALKPPTRLNDQEYAQLINSTDMQWPIVRPSA